MQLARGNGVSEAIISEALPTFDSSSFDPDLQPLLADLNEKAKAHSPDGAHHPKQPAENASLVHFCSNPLLFSIAAIQVYTW